MKLKKYPIFVNAFIIIFIITLIGNYQNGLDFLSASINGTFWGVIAQWLLGMFIARNEKE